MSVEVTPALLDFKLPVFTRATQDMVIFGSETELAEELLGQPGVELVNTAIADDVAAICSVGQRFRPYVEVLAELLVDTPEQPCLEREWCCDVECRRAYIAEQACAAVLNPEHGLADGGDVERRLVESHKDAGVESREGGRLGQRRDARVTGGRDLAKAAGVEEGLSVAGTNAKVKMQNARCEWPELGAGLHFAP